MATFSSETKQHNKGKIRQEICCWNKADNFSDPIEKAKPKEDRERPREKRKRKKKGKPLQ